MYRYVNLWGIVEIVERIYVFIVWELQVCESR